MALPILAKTPNTDGEKIDLLQASLNKQEDNDFTNKDSDFMQIQFKMYDSLINIFEIQKDIFKFMVGQDRKEKIKKDTATDKGNLKDTAGGVGKGSMFGAIKDGMGKQEGLIPKMLGGLFEGIKHALLLGVILFKDKILKFFSKIAGKGALGKTLGFIFKRLFTALIAIPTMIYGFVEEFMKSGDIGKAFGAAVGQLVELISFGLVDKETIKNVLDDAGSTLGLAIHDFFAQIGDWFNNLTKYLVKEFPRLASMLGIKTPEEKLANATAAVSNTEKGIATIDANAATEIESRNKNEKNPEIRKRNETRILQQAAKEKAILEKNKTKQTRELFALQQQKKADDLGIGPEFTKGTVTSSNLDYGQKANSTGVGRNNKVDGYGDDVNADKMESYIRESAIKNNIDPDVAVRVWQSEGAMSYQSGVTKGNMKKLNGREASFGPFQLYTGGGLGNDFEKQYGKKLAESNDWEGVQQQIDFAMQKASKQGWKPWYGAAKVGIGNKQGIGVPQQAPMMAMANAQQAPMMADTALKIAPTSGVKIASTSSEVKQQERSSQSPTVIGGATNNSTVVNNVSSGGGKGKGNVPPRSINNPAAHVPRNYTLGINR